MKLFERRVDEWVLIGRDLAVGPTDIDAADKTVRLIANGRRLGGPSDGEPFKDVHEASVGQTLELGPQVWLSVLDIVGDAVRLGVNAPRHIAVLAHEDADRRGL